MRMGPSLVLLIICAFLEPLAAISQETFIDEASSISFPKEIQFVHRGDSYILQATGSTVRRKWFVKGYAIAHYMQFPPKGAQEEVLNEIFSPSKAKQVTMHWLHRLPKELIHEGYEESLKKVLSDQEMISMKEDIDKFLHFFIRDAEVGDIHFIRWLPGGYLELIVNDERRGGLVSLELAKAIWGIWFGPKSVVNRASLIRFLVTNEG